MVASPRDAYLLRAWDKLLQDAPSSQEGGGATCVSQGWFLSSTGNAVSLAGFREGHSLLCGQPWALEVFASPPGTAGVQMDRFPWV